MNQQFFMLSEEGLKVLAEQISNIIESKMQETKVLNVVTTNQDVFLNITKLSELIGLTKTTIYGHVHRNTIPFIKKGKMLRFSKIDILNWLDEGKSTSKSNLESKANEYLMKNQLFNR
jgi:excisionase family DNA binding protein